MMLHETLKRTIANPPSRQRLRPLIPWIASLTTATHGAPGEPPSPVFTPAPQARKIANVKPRDTSRTKSESTTGPAPFETRQSYPTTTPPNLPPSVRELLPLLQAQTPHYINVHIHGKPYLLTEGDTLRLPFIMHGVEPGDVLRLNRALHLGSRDFTLKAGAAAPAIQSATRSHGNASEIVPSPPPETSAATETASRAVAPHFIPHIAKGKHAYVDERLYECRAIVLGSESEPMRIKEKTKRRQRHTKRVRSKHRFTVLKIKELRVRGVEELEAEVP